MTLPLLWVLKRPQYQKITLENKYIAKLKIRPQNQGSGNKPV